MDQHRLIVSLEIQRIWSTDQRETPQILGLQSLPRFCAEGLFGWAWFGRPVCLHIEVDQRPQTHLKFLKKRIYIINGRTYIMQSIINPTLAFLCLALVCLRLAFCNKDYPSLPINCHSTFISHLPTRSTYFPGHIGLCWPTNHLGSPWGQANGTKQHMSFTHLVYFLEKTSSRELSPNTSNIFKWGSPSPQPGVSLKSWPAAKSPSCPHLRLGKHVGLTRCQIEAQPFGVSDGCREECNVGSQSDFKGA